MKKEERRKYAALSPFQLKDRLIQLANSHSERMMLNAGRGNPNWLATIPRTGFFQLGLFAVEESQRVLPMEYLGGVPPQEGIAQRLKQFLIQRSGLAGISFLQDCLTYVEVKLSLDPDDFVNEMVQGILGDRYPEPMRVLTNAEKILHQYLVQELCNDRPPGKYDLFVTEGGTAAICYIFNSLLENKILHKHDKIALGTPIFTPYLEIPHLNNFRFISLEVEAWEPLDWQIPEAELDKLTDPEVKAFFLCNPSNPSAVRMLPNVMAKLAELVNTQRPDLIIITDDVYSTFVNDFHSLMAVIPHNTITVYSYSKYFGATGWRLGAIALHEENVIDRAIAILPESATNVLNKRYEHLALEPQKLKFIDRLVADSRNVALNHTAGLSTPQQVQMVLFSLFCLLDGNDDYKKTCQAIVTKRFNDLYQALGITPHDSLDRTHYYTTIDLLKLAIENYGSDFVEYLVKHFEPLDFVFRLALDRGIVLLPGGGFDAPQWSVRVSLANLPDEAYLSIGQAIVDLMASYHDEWKAADWRTLTSKLPHDRKMATRVGSMTNSSKEQSNDRNCFDYHRECGTGNHTDVKPIPGIMLIGGAEEGRLGEDAATRWFLKRADGGNYLVLRSGGIGSQAGWICDNYRDFIASAAELSIDSRAAANNPDVIQYIRNADALFIAGGNQNEYEDYWEGSAVEEAVNYLINRKKVPVAGTSAGMAIFGDYYYAPAHEGLLSSEILNDPFHHNTKDIYRSDFIKVSFLKHVITDTHLDRKNEDHPETRYGRLFGFLARVVHDTGNQFPVYGIGLEEGAFVAIDEKGIAKVFGNGTTKGQDAYFLQTLGTAPEQIQPELPLIWNNNRKAVKVYKISGTPQGSGHFDLNNWSNADGGSWEYWFTTGGESGFQFSPLDKGRAVSFSSKTDREIGK
jgi:aspartate 4-decarboxylase